MVKDLQLDLKTLKQRLEFEAELERSGSRAAKSDEVRREQTEPLMVDAYSTTVSGAQADTVVGNVRTSSSAEYIVGEIRRHKRSFTLALSVFIAAIAVAGWWLYSSQLFAVQVCRHGNRDQALHQFSGR